jgi:hypothetical protein
MKDTKQHRQVDNEFDAAKIIVETLQQLDEDRKKRALRFAREALGLGPEPSHSGTSGAPSATQHQTSAQEHGRHGPGRTMDIRTFTASKAPKTDQQFAAVVAYYYRFEAPPSQRKDAIGAKDLSEAVRLVERRRPGSALATLNNAKNKGYLDAVGRAKFQINAVGENLVAMALPDKDRPKTSRTMLGGKRKRRKLKPPPKRKRRGAK